VSEDPHELPAERVVDRFESRHDGLTDDEVRRRLEEHGENDVVRSGGRSPIDIFVAQFDSVLIWVLLAAAVLSVWAGHTVDAVLIAIIVVANGIFGFVQDYRAEQSLESLRELASPTARVRRNGEVREVDATELVPGDIVVLRGGDVVPADGRLLEATDLEADEAALTGESVPVTKSAAPAVESGALAEREHGLQGDQCHSREGRRGRHRDGDGDRSRRDRSGTRRDRGDAYAPAGRTQRAGSDPRTRRARSLGAGRAAVTRARNDRGPGRADRSVARRRGDSGGLPAVVTLTLALGVRKMSEENALVRRLPAVEALGAVDVVCTDKTGTLTKGQMTVSKLWVNDAVIDVDSADTDADVRADRTELLLRIGALCNDSTLEDDGGDPTELALLEAADGRGFDANRLRSDNPRTDEVPFSSEHKWMGTVHDDVGYVKGAPEVVVENCDRILTADGAKPMSDDRRERIETTVREFGDDALRVLAMAYRDDPAEADDLVDGLTFVGLTGMIDPPREEVADAIDVTKRAGIAVKMVTGDNVRTARAIAESLGIGTDVLEGPAVERMDDETLRERVAAVDVFARTSPDHKVRILRALQAQGTTSR